LLRAITAFVVTFAVGTVIFNSLTSVVMACYIPFFEVSELRSERDHVATFLFQVGLRCFIRDL